MWFIGIQWDLMDPNGIHRIIMDWYALECYQT